MSEWVAPAAAAGGVLLLALLVWALVRRRPSDDETVFHRARDLTSGWAQAEPAPPSTPSDAGPGSQPAEPPLPREGAGQD